MNQDKKFDDVTEYDVKLDAWKLYGSLYRDIIGEIKYKDIVIEGKRPYIEKRMSHNNKSVLLKLSGETDFNFSSHTIVGLGKSRVKFLEYFTRELNDEIEKEDFKKRVNNCMKHYHSKMNISLMPQTGSLNLAKQSIGNDRLDTFIWALNEYYVSGNEMILVRSSNENYSLLKEYLDLFDDVYDYCKTIYFISEDLTRNMIEFGTKSINSSQRASDYMKLAERFWEEKQEHINTILENSLVSL